jgi:hypothetical protein
MRSAPMKMLKKKHALAIRWFHWINFPVFFLMIWSGLLIYWSNAVYRIGLGSYTLLTFFPERFFQALGIPYHLAKGMSLHFFFMWFFVINGVLYVALHVHFRRVALSGAEPPFIPGSDSGRASRFASEQDRTRAAKIQRRAADCLHNRDPGRGGGPIGSPAPMGWAKCQSFYLHRRIGFLDLIGREGF